MMLGRGFTTALLVVAPGLVFVLALVAFEQRLEQAVGLVAFGGTWVLWSLGVLYERWEQCHLFVHRSRLRLLNASVRWSASIDMRLTDQCWDLEQFKGIAVALAGSRPPSVLRSDPDRVVITYHDMTVEARISDRIASPSDEEWTSGFCVRVHPVVFPYRAAHRRFDALVLFLEKIERNIRPASAKYSVEIDFDEARNPYFGLYVQRAVPIGRFTWEFTRTFEDGTSSLRIGRENVAITTRSLVHLGQMYRRYLALGSLRQLG